MNTILNSARSLAAVGLGLGILVAAGCGGGGEDQAQAPQHAATADAPSPDHSASTGTAGETTVAGIAFTPPDSWQSLGASGMRQAQYRLAPVAGDEQAAEVNVFYFGPQSGGGTDANLQRWIGQMSLPGGGDPASAAERDEFSVDGMTVHTVALDGTYQGGMGGPMSGDAEPEPGSRLVGAVVEGPQGSVFFKLTGPEATAKAMEDDLLAMIRAARAVD